MLQMSNCGFSISNNAEHYCIIIISFLSLQGLKMKRKKVKLHRMNVTCRWTIHPATESKIAFFFLFSFFFFFLFFFFFFVIFLCCVTAGRLQNKFSKSLLFQEALNKKRWLHDEDCDLVKYLVAVGMIVVFVVHVNYFFFLL